MNLRQAVQKGSVSRGAGETRRIEVELDELDDVDVDYISLVKRGANRAPFKIVKREEDPTMLDFGKAFKEGKLFARKAAKPRIAALLVNKTDYSDSIVAQIQEQGFTPIETEDQGNLIVLKLETFDKDDALIIKLTEDIAAVVANVRKQFLGFPESTSFKENLDQAGFVPGIAMSMDTLMATLSNVLHEGKSKSDVRSMLGDALDQFKTHVMQLMDTVPETAFKLESIVRGDVANKPVDASKDEGKEKVTETVKEEPVEPETKASEASQKADPEKDSETAAKDDKDDDDQMAKLTAALISTVENKLSGLRGEILESLNKNEKKVENLSEALEAQKEELTGKLETAKAEMSAAVNGTIHRGSSDDDNISEGANGTRRKADGADDAGIFDTAFSFPGFEIALEDRVRGQ